MFPELKIRRISQEEIEAENRAQLEPHKYPSYIPWDRENPHPELSDVRKPFCHYLAGFDVLQMLKDINSIRNWNNGVDYISADFNQDWHLVQMNIGIYNPAKDAYQVISPARQDFLDIMADVLQLYQELYPNKAGALQAEYAILLKTFSGHKYYE